MFACVICNKELKPDELFRCQQCVKIIKNCPTRTFLNFCQQNTSLTSEVKSEVVTTFF